MKFIHAADIHLDSPLKGLARYEGAPVDELRGATRKAFVRLIDLCLEEQVDFLVIAGDLYDGDWRDFNTGLFFSGQMSRLREAGIPVYMIRGNHDAASRITKQIPLPDNVTVFSGNRPETYHLEHLGVAIHGQSFATPSVKENLAMDYPVPVKGYFNIGILHTSLNGREDHDDYAPCSASELVAKEYDYWALGHIHKREIIQENPWIVYPGNIQGRHAKEAGDKGCYLVHVQNGETELEYRSLDVLRWTACEVDVTGAEDTEEIYRKINDAMKEEIRQAEGIPLAVRLTIKGTCPAHDELTENLEQTINSIRAVVMDASFGDIWVEKIKIHTERWQNLHHLLHTNTPLAHLLKFTQTVSEDEDMLLEMLDALKPLKLALPHDIYGEDLPTLDNPGIIRSEMKEIEQILLTHLMKKEW